MGACATMVEETFSTPPRKDCNLVPLDTPPSDTPSPVLEPRTPVSTTTGSELFPEKDVVAISVGGELFDLDRDLPPGVEVSAVMASSEEGLAIVRHSTAHVLAQAVQKLFPEAKLGIGPPITDGF